MPSEVYISAEFRHTAEECPESLTDEELTLALRSAAGKQERDHLFGEIFRRYHPRVRSWCFRLTRNRNHALDLAQEVFLKAHRHIHGFRGDSRLSTWLYSITRNHCLSSLRKLATDPVETGEIVPLRLRDMSAMPPDAAIERGQLCQEMWRVMTSTLEPLEVRVMALHYGYDMPLAAITERLALSNPSGAKAYVVNARRKLNSVLERRGMRARRPVHEQPMSRAAA
jgi:RNA polymerase sigma factor (sigma-70 family)